MPVYKAEKYLPQCIESILAQTFTDFELLLIDDGSPDRSGEICDEYARKDSRIRVFHQENAGVSATRNVGLKNSKGRYVNFVDSDDYVLPDFLKDLYDDLPKEEGKSVVVHTALKCYSNGTFAQVALPDTDLEKNTIYRLLTDYGGMEIGYSCTKLFDNELIQRKQLHFKENIHLLEDLFFFYDYVQCADWVRIRNVPNYMYRVGYSNEALSVRYNSLEEEISIFHTYHDYIRKFVQESKQPSSCFANSWQALRFYFHRVLLVLYSTGERKSYTDRIACLKELYREYHTWILAYFKPDYLVDRITAYFLQRKWYVCVDLWMRLLLAVHFQKMFGGERKINS